MVRPGGCSPGARRRAGPERSGVPAIAGAGSAWIVGDTEAMDNPRPEKVAVVNEVKGRIGDSEATLLSEYRGLSVKELAELRNSLRPFDADYKIYKNTLVRFAVRELDLPDLEQSLTGPTAITFIKGDPAGAAKALRDFSRTYPSLVIKGGVLGEKTLTAKDAGALAELPSREVALAQLAGLLAQPLQQFAGLLQALPRNFAYGLKALVEKGGAEGAAPSDGESASATPEAAEPSSEVPESAPDPAGVSQETPANQLEPPAESEQEK